MTSRQTYGEDESARRAQDGGHLCRECCFHCYDVEDGYSCCWCKSEPPTEPCPLQSEPEGAKP